MTRVNQGSGDKVPSLRLHPFPPHSKPHLTHPGRPVNVFSPASLLSEGEDPVDPSPLLPCPVPSRPKPPPGPQPRPVRPHPRLVREVPHVLHRGRSSGPHRPRLFRGPHSPGKSGPSPPCGPCDLVGTPSLLSQKAVSSLGTAPGLLPSGPSSAPLGPARPSTPASRREVPPEGCGSGLGPFFGASSGRSSLVPLRRRTGQLGPGARDLSSTGGSVPKFVHFSPAGRRASPLARGSRRRH